MCSDSITIKEIPPKKRNKVQINTSKANNIDKTNANGMDIIPIIEITINKIDNIFSAFVFLCFNCNRSLNQNLSLEYTSLSYNYLSIGIICQYKKSTKLYICYCIL